MLRDLRYALKAEFWKRRGSTPGGAGWNAAKRVAIRRATAGTADGKYGYDDAGIDERVVEYAWIFDRLRSLRTADQRVLDAGSILNHPDILDSWQRASFPPASIVTLGYEGQAFVSDSVRYEFGDLRDLPYRDELFSIVLCVSTLEHVGLDTSLYVRNTHRERERERETRASDPGTEAIKAIRELHRVTRPGGRMLLSVPFGTASNRGWLRIFDSNDLMRLIDNSTWTVVTSRFFRATELGWRECAERDVSTAGYNEPANRGGVRTAPPFVAAAEAVALVELERPK